MKKMLVLMLVLGMASIANATVLTWSVDAITITATGLTAVVQLVADNADMYDGKEVGNEPSLIASISGIVARASAGDIAVVKNPTVYGYPGWWLVQALDAAPPTAVSSGAQYDVTVSGLATGTHQFMSDHYGTNDMLQVTVLPEPTTVALLGLGGLLMLRRRK